MPRGYGRALYILLFVHRGSFQAKMFDWKLFVDLFEQANPRLPSELSGPTRS